MNKDFAAAMRRAASSVRARDLTGATRIIQAALSGRPVAAKDAAPSPPGGAQPDGLTIDESGNVVDPPPHQPSDARAGARMRKPMAEVLRVLREARARNQPAPAPGGLRPAPVAVPDGARFLARSFSGPAGTRDYKLYIPSCDPAELRGLIVMLHGCKQNPDDFAAGTDMNAVAEANRLIVAYPGQSGPANALSCWNWFDPADQARGAGEPSIIAGLTRDLMREFAVDRDRVFVAGLSAGGAMAVVMGETYPDLFSAVGVHSGLAYRAANDVVSAFAAMRGEFAAPRNPASKPRHSSAVRLIVFQGDADQTVHLSNAERIVAAARPSGDGVRIAQNRGTAGQRGFTRTTIVADSGACLIDYWLIDGAGHAWSGGKPSGSYTDARGPDASTEMVRFFLDGSTRAV